MLKCESVFVIAIASIVIYTDSHRVAMSVCLSRCLSRCLRHQVQLFPRPLIGPEITWSVPGLSLVLPPPPLPPIPPPRSPLPCNRFHLKIIFFALKQWKTLKMAIFVGFVTTLIFEMFFQLANGGPCLPRFGALPAHRS